MGAAAFEQPPVSNVPQAGFEQPSFQHEQPQQGYSYTNFDASPYTTPDIPQTTNTTNTNYTNFGGSAFDSPTSPTSPAGGRMAGNAAFDQGFKQGGIGAHFVENVPAGRNVF